MRKKPNGKEVEITTHSYKKHVFQRALGELNQKAVRQYYWTSEEMHVQGSCRTDPRELTRIVGTASTRAEREGQSPDKFPVQRNECLQLRPWPPGCCALAPAASIKTKTKTKECGGLKPGTVVTCEKAGRREDNYGVDNVAKICFQREAITETALRENSTKRQIFPQSVFEEGASRYPSACQSQSQSE